MNKTNYILALALTVLLTSNGVLYSKINNLSKEISEVKKEQINQQTSQKEAIQNLQNLVTFNWKEYGNDEFGFSFKYPEYVNICDDTIKSQDVKKVDLNLNIRTGGEFDTCDTRDVPPLHIIVKKNTENYKTAEEAFYKELSKEYISPDPSYTKELQETYASVVKTNFAYLKIGGLDGYGGKIVSSKPSSDQRITRWENYGIIILKNDYIIKFSDDSYDQVFENKRLGDKPIFDAIISSLYFSPSGLLK